MEIFGENTLGCGGECGGECGTYIVRVMFRSLCSWLAG